MHNIYLPFLDNTGQLTPLVIAAMAAGATSDHNPDTLGLITLSFDDEEALEAFAEAVDALSPGNDPVDDADAQA